MERVFMMFLFTACTYVSICFSEPERVGCYRDTRSKRLLDGAYTVSKSMTREQCHSFCYKRRSRYFGVEFGEECFCGNKLSPDSKTDDSECEERKCSGDSGSACGGDLRILVFRTRVKNPPYAFYMGCYVHLSDHWWFTSETSAELDTMTNDWCKIYCKDHDFRYAGTEYSKKCFCSNVRPSYKFRTDTEECNMPCAGDPMEKCGDDKRLNLYDMSGYRSDTVGHLHIGCIRDELIGNASLHTEVSKHMTPEYCVGLCYKKLHLYSWINKGNACHCGDRTLRGLNRTETSPPSRTRYCSQSCAGIPAYICGGETYSSYYYTGIHVPEATYMGCYVDPSSQSRLLRGSHTLEDTMTNDRCKIYCKDQGFQYAGTEYSKECYCSNVRPSYKFRADSGECDMPCAGDPMEKCGGDLRLSLFDISGKHSNAVSHLDVGCFTVLYEHMSSMNHTEVSEHMTPEYCVGLCYKKQNLYSFINKGNTCHCGDSSDLVGGLAQFDCQKRCAGDPAMKCGDESSLSVYNTGMNGRGIRESPKYLGCFEDSAERTLNGPSQINQQLDHKVCLKFCYQKGYRFTGMEYGSECYCGDHLAMHLEVAGPECSEPCSGNSNEVCGGSWRLSVFATGHVVDD